MSAMTLFRSSSPAGGKSTLRKLYESTMDYGERARSTLVASGGALRQGGESLIVGGILGAAHVELPTGLDIHGKIPLDAVVAGMGLLGSVFLAKDEVHNDLRNAGSAAAAVFAFRKTHDLLEEKKKQRGETPGSTAGKAPATTPATASHSGEFGEDSILTIARKL